jgi:hypothetical protein
MTSEVPDPRASCPGSASRCRAWAPGEHDAEQEQHDDGADVDHDLGDGHELGAQQDELGGGAGEHHHQVDRGVHDVGGGDHRIAPKIMMAAMMPKATFWATSTGASALWAAARRLTCGPS